MAAFSDALVRELESVLGEQAVRQLSDISEARSRRRLRP